jgi:hypothetical protein
MAARRNRDESRDNSPIMSVTRNTWTTQRTGKSCCRRHPSAWGRPRTRVIGARQRGRRLFFGAALFSAVWVVRLRRTEMLHKEKLLLPISSLPRIFAADIFDGQMALQKPQQKSCDSHGLFAKRNSLKYQKSQIPGLASQISWVLRNRLWRFSVPLSRTGHVERWLKAPVCMPDGTLIRPEKGTPQGSVVSQGCLPKPVKSNGFLWTSHFAPAAIF